MNLFYILKILFEPLLFPGTVLGCGGTDTKMWPLALRNSSNIREPDKEIARYTWAC